jgi:urease accessory protein
MKLAKPFWRGGVREFMYMCAGPGLLEGDHLDISLEIGKGCSALATGQSYTKIFKSERVGSAMSVTASIGEGARLFYQPPPVIPFAGSSFKANSVFRLERSSRLFLCDAVSCGRAGMSERFMFDGYMSRTAVYVEDKPVFLDNTRLNPKEYNPAGIGFFEGHTHMGFVYVYGFDVTLPAAPDGAEAALTAASAGTVIRILADSGDTITNFAAGILTKCMKQEGSYPVIPGQARNDGVEKPYGHTTSE